MSGTLAIVMPAWKGRFLNEALQALAAQTRRDFTLYVGDDASPEDLRSLCAVWADRVDVRYTRFEHNLGGTDLVGHWERCLALSDEPWVWLVGDDDLLPPDGVARVLEAIDREGAVQPLLRLDVAQIDGAGQLLEAPDPWPAHLSGRAFAMGRLRFALPSFATEYVFSRAALQRAGGFVRFPRAWCSDDATWLQIAGDRGIRTLPGAPVRWRRSGLNISSTHAQDAVAKTQAQVEFIAWLRGWLERHPVEAGQADDTAFEAQARRWFFQQARIMNLSFDAALARKVRATLGRGSLTAALNVRVALLRQNLRAQRGR